MGSVFAKSNKNKYEVQSVVSNNEFNYENANNESATTQTASAIATTVPVAVIAAPTQQMEEEVEFDPKIIPQWVNAEYFSDVLKENVKNFEKISNFKAYPALSAGENYATLMLRVSIEMQLNDKSTQNKSFMLKVPHDSAQMKAMMGTMNVFATENAMYFDVLPELQQMYQAAGGQETQFAANSYRFVKDPGCQNVLLEDLRPRGYKNANRLEGLDREHIKCVLKKLAQFHATSACRFEAKGAYNDVMMNGLINEQMKHIFDPIMNRVNESFLKNIKTCKDAQKYYEIMEKHFAKYLDGYIVAMKYDNDNFNVLNHGDCWSNNILFKYDDVTGKVQDAIFVDFQGPKYGSPAQDLYYFLISSAAIDVKVKEFDSFIRYYFDHLIESLEMLKYPKKLPILRELHMQLYRYGFWSISTVVIILPIVMLEPTKNATLENFMSLTEDGEKFRQMLHTNPRYLNCMGELLPWLHNRGLLEHFDFGLKESSANEIVPTIEAPKPEAPKPEAPIAEAPKSEAIKAEAPKAEAPIAEAPKASETSRIPEWVTEERFVEVMQENVKNFKQIKRFDVGPATNAGDNYLSLMLQVDIDAELKDGDTLFESYMLKISPSSAQAKAMVDSLGSFKKETLLYTDYITQFEQLYKAAGKDVTFAPKSLKISEEPGCDIILLQNLRPLGFKNADRFEGLNQQQVECVLSKLAGFHAASACYYVTNGNYPKILNGSFYTEENRAAMQQMGDLFFGMFLESAKSFAGNEEYIEKLGQFKTKFHDSMIAANVIDPNGFNVLNHGDCWTNNILFQYDNSGVITNTYFVDYQLPKFGSPAQDLYYFLLSSPAFDIKLKQFNYFIRYYHDNLVRNLELLKYPREIPTLKQLHTDLLKFGGWGPSTVTGVLSAVLLPASKDCNLENMLSDGEAGLELKKQMFTNAKYCQHAEAILLWLNRRGLLDL